MGLCSDHKGMLFELYHFNEIAIRTCSRNNEAVLFKLISILVVELVAMTVTLCDSVVLLYVFVYTRDISGWFEEALVSTKSHGSSFFAYRSLVFHHVDDVVCSVRCKFFAIGVWIA